MSDFRAPKAAQEAMRAALRAKWGRVAAVMRATGFGRMTIHNWVTRGEVPFYTAFDMRERGISLAGIPCAAKPPLLGRPRKTAR